MSPVIVSVTVALVPLSRIQQAAMVQPVAWHCPQLWAGALVLGLALGADDGVVVKQKDEAGPVGSVSFRLMSCRADKGYEAQ